MPVMSSYARRLSDAVKRVYPASGFYTVASHGGLLSTRTVGSEPVRTILSGPAAGIAATVHLASTIGAPNVIAYDMGGTSTDVALVAEGSFPLRRESILEGLVLRLPQLDIHTVGAGGGSIAAIDGGGGLQLGPESAGAIPGPACYGRGGTRPTVTDADVVLGLIGAGQRLGDSLQVDRPAAERALGALASQAGVVVVEMADAVLRLAVAKMAAAIYEISVARGFDPRDFALVSYGGAGPLHAALVADEVGIRRVIIPPAPGAFSAFGALCSALAKDRARTLLRPCDAEAMAEADRHFAVMADELRAEFADEGAALERIVHERQLDLRYHGQAHELTIDAPAGMPVGAVIERFEAAFEREYGRRDRGRGIELVNIRLIARIPLDMPRFAPARPGSGAPAERIIGIGGAATPCPVWKREDLPADASWQGPLIVEEMSATTFVPAGWTLRQGAFGELNLECEASD
jgi:N-methylhydantoinase A